MTEQEIVDGLLWPCWRGIPEDYKRKYVRNVWQQFEDNIRSAAYTSSLPKCFEALCRRLNIEIRSDDLQAVSGIVNSTQGRAVMRALREETMALVLMVRLKNEERKEQFGLGKETVSGDKNSARKEKQ